MQAYFWVTAVKSRNVTVDSFYKRYCENAELDFKRDNAILWKHFGAFYLYIDD